MSAVHTALVLCKNREACKRRKETVMIWTEKLNARVKVPTNFDKGYFWGASHRLRDKLPLVRRQSSSRDNVMFFMRFMRDF